MQTKIDGLKSQEGHIIRVSDHAIVRYLERVSGLNIEKLKRKICSKETEIAILTLGNGRYPIGDKNQVVVENHVVVTVVGFGEPNDS